MFYVHVMFIYHILYTIYKIPYTSISLCFYVAFLGPSIFPAAAEASARLTARSRMIPAVVQEASK